MSGRSTKVQGRARNTRASQKRKAGSDPEPELVVKAEPDEENNVATDVCDGEASTSIKTKLNPCWEWEADGGIWTPFTPELNTQIDLSFSTGKRFVTVSPVAGLSLQIDMQKMVQKNIQSGFQRPVRLAVQDCDKHFVWQWRSDKGAWISYDACTCLALEAGFQSKAKVVPVSLGDTYTYIIDLQKMVQKNSQTQFERQIQRCLSSSDLAPMKKSIIRAPAKRARGSKSVKNLEYESEQNKEQVRTLLMKGKAPVDPECSNKLGKAHVFCEGDDVYDVMLNQTNLQFNNNKFYIIQLLEDDGVKHFSVWMRWGRVGKVGKNSLVSCGSDLQKAKDIFQKKFFDKTKNLWTERAQFEKCAGKYDMLQVDYNATESEIETAVKEKSLSDIPKPKSQLDSSIQELIELICNLKAMEETILEMKFDIKKAPLGKLTVEQIHAGYCSLQHIENCIKKRKFGRDLLEACNEFYTRIPHDFGLRTPPLIRTLEDMTAKVQLLEALGDIQIAVKLASKELGSLEHPIVRQYRQLNCSMQPLDKTSSAFQLIEDYLLSTHAPTHNDYTMTLLQVFKLQRVGEESNFRADLPNRMLLWHGSRLTNWVGILSQGLRVAPPEAPLTGYMFGKGIYFADVSSKSANYCFSSRDKNEGILLLSEVALGDCNEILAADYNAQKKLKSKHSTKGLGRSIPDPKKSIIHEGAVVPLGPLICTTKIKNSGYKLNYNEYIVYDPHQVRMKYLLKVRFNYRSLW